MSPARPARSFAHCRGRSHSGFTLIEVSIALVIIGLLIGMGAQMLPLLVKQNKFKETRVLVSETKTALIGYAMANGKLPYAAAGTNGIQTAGRLNGYLPWATLGIRGVDPYARTLYYAVESHLATSAASSLPQLKSNLESLLNGTTTPDLYCNYVSAASNIKSAFVVISSGENLRVDSPNDDNNNGRVDVNDDNRFASPAQTITSTYDDTLETMEIAQLYGLCIKIMP